jgi:hypothetical protein
LRGFSLSPIAHEESLHLPHAGLAQLLWKLFRISSGVERLLNYPPACLVMTVPTARVVIGDDDVRTQQTNLQHHATQCFFFTPGAKRFFSRLRETEITEAEEVWLGALHFRGCHRFASANHAEFFVEFRTNCVLSALAKRREERDGVNAIFAAQDS